MIINRGSIPWAKSLGFTLIELVMVIVIVGILGTMTSKIITLPVNNYLNQARRAALVDAAEMALRRMQRDVRRALPNSIRISGNSLEMLHTLDGGRYRALQSTAPASVGCHATDPAKDILDFNSAAGDDCFEVMGALKSFNPTATHGEYLVVYNLSNIDNAPASAYTGDNRTAVQNSANTAVVKFTAKQFPYASPLQRFFIVDTPVTYRCDTSNADVSKKYLWRHASYTITTTQSTTPSGGVADIQANNITQCTFTYSAGVAMRAAQLSVSITLTDSAGDNITIVRQIHVDNAS